MQVEEEGTHFMRFANKKKTIKAQDRIE